MVEAQNKKGKLIEMPKHSKSKVKKVKKTKSKAKKKKAYGRGY